MWKIVLNRAKPYFWQKTGPHLKMALALWLTFESHKINRVVVSTTASEIYAFTKCFGTCQCLRGLWMDISAACVAIHTRTDANNLVTSASTTRLTEQKKTIHMIQMLNREACSGQIEDHPHVASADCLSDCITKSLAKSDALVKAVSTSVLNHIDMIHYLDHC